MICFFDSILYTFDISNNVDEFSDVKATRARREQSELYGREYDQGKVTYNDIYI